MARGHDVVVATLRGIDGAIPGVRTVRLRRLGPSSYPFAVGLDEWLTWADVVHVHGLDGLADVATLRHPAVGISTHGGYFHTDRWSMLKWAMARSWTKATLRRASAVWFTSETDRSAYGWPPGSPVIGDGVDPTELAAAPNTSRVPGRWVVPGRVDVHKGLDDLIRQLPPRSSGVELRVVGPEVAPGWVDELRRIAEGRAVRFLGPLPRRDLLMEIAAADLVVLPSRREGFGIAALEAMTLGAPLVCSNISAFQELMGRGGVDFRGPPLDWPALHAEAIAAVPARRQLAAAHTWPVVARRFEEAYLALGWQR